MEDREWFYLSSIFHPPSSFFLNPLDLRIDLGEFLLQAFDLQGVVHLPFGPGELLPEMVLLLTGGLDLLFLLLIERHGKPRLKTEEKETLGQCSDVALL